MNVREGDPPRDPGLQARMDIRRRDLVQAASRLFLTRGFRSVSVADIVDDVGLSHGTFYNYFDSRRDILEAVLDAAFELLATHLFDENDPPASDSLDEFVERFECFAGRALALADDELELLQFVVFEAPSIDAAVTERLIVNYRGFGAIFAEYVREGVEKGFLRPDVDVDEAGRAIAALMVGCAVGATNAMGSVVHSEFGVALGDFLRYGFGSTV